MFFRSSLGFIAIEDKVCQSVDSQILVFLSCIFVKAQQSSLCHPNMKLLTFPLLFLQTQPPRSDLKCESHFSMDVLL